MLIDQYQRKIDYLRISVTDRCNLRCVYCMPEYGILSYRNFNNKHSEINSPLADNSDRPFNKGRNQIGNISPIRPRPFEKRAAQREIGARMKRVPIWQKSPSEILTFEEIVKIVNLSIGIGINKIKVTGGEPLVRRNLSNLLYSLSNLIGLKDLSLTTNGILVRKYARELKNAGLKRLNISIDTLDEQKFKHISRVGNLSEVLEGIDAAIKESFFIKLNVVVMKGLNDDEILRFVNFAQDRQLIVRFIELMPTLNCNGENQDLYISCSEIKDRMKFLGNLEAIVSDEVFGNGPARYYKIGNSSSIVGFISPMSCKFCSSCNRIRLTSTGILIPCLANNNGFDLRGSLRQGKETEVLALFKKAACLKPVGHHLDSDSCCQSLMSQIGG